MNQTQLSEDAKLLWQQKLWHLTLNFKILMFTESFLICNIHTHIFYWLFRFIFFSLELSKISIFIFIRFFTGDLLKRTIAIKYGNVQHSTYLSTSSANIKGVNVEKNIQLLSELSPLEAVSYIRKSLIILAESELSTLVVSSQQVSSLSWGGDMKYKYLLWSEHQLR